MRKGSKGLNKHKTKQLKKSASSTIYRFCFQGKYWPLCSSYRICLSQQYFEASNTSNCFFSAPKIPSHHSFTLKKSLPVEVYPCHEIKREQSVHLSLFARLIDRNANIAKKEHSKMLLTIKGKSSKIHPLIDQHRPRRGVASGRHPASPSGTVQAGQDRPGRLVGQEPGQQRTPAKMISSRANKRRHHCLPKLGYQRAFSPTIRKASRSYSWIWPRCRSIEDFSCGGR
jgi:hypothetical protein